MLEKIIIAVCLFTLWQAALDNNIEAVKSELAKGAPVFSTAQNGATPLHFAASRANADMVKLLISEGASAKATTAEGATPLQFAASYGADISVKRKTQRSGYNAPNSNEETNMPLPTAAELDAKVMPCVLELLKAGADLNATGKRGGSALLSAASNGYTNVCKILLAHGARANL